MLSYRLLPEEVVDAVSLRIMLLAGAEVAVGVGVVVEDLGSRMLVMNSLSKMLGLVETGIIRKPNRHWFFNVFLSVLIISRHRISN